MLPKDRKVMAVGLTRMLTSSALMRQEPLLGAWSVHETGIVEDC